MSENSHQRSSKRSSPSILKEIAEHEFAFLVKDLDFLGPEVSAEGVFYHSPSLSVDILAARSERYVVTFLRARVGDVHCRSELSCLYVEAGLGPAQRVSWSAGTRHSMAKTLHSQAVALRDLLPALAGPEGRRLMLACHGR